MPQILDAMGHPPASAVKAASYLGVAAYFSNPGNPKNLTPELAQAYSSEGLWVVSVFESTANRALGGQAAGHADGLSAVSQAQACGAPPNCVLYAAVDFEPTTAQLPVIGDYFAGWKAALGAHSPGGYGNNVVVDYLFSRGLITHGWQTVAWSGGVRSSKACLFQEAHQVTVGGVTCDVNDVLMADFGGWKVGQSPDSIFTSPIIEGVIMDLAKDPTDAMRGKARELWRDICVQNVPDEHTLDIIVYSWATNGYEAAVTACTDSPRGQSVVAAQQRVLGI